MVPVGRPWSPGAPRQFAWQAWHLETSTCVSRGRHGATTTTLITLHNNYNSTTLRLQLQLLYTTVHPAIVGDDYCNHCIHSKKYNSNYLSVHPWIRSAIRDSQQATAPIGFLFLKLLPAPCAAPLGIYLEILKRKKVHHFQRKKCNLNRIYFFFPKQCAGWVLFAYLQCPVLDVVSTCPKSCFPLSPIVSPHACLC